MYNETMANMWYLYFARLSLYVFQRGIRRADRHADRECRETQPFVKLRGLFKFGKLFFSIRKTDDFMDYLNANGL